MVSFLSSGGRGAEEPVETSGTVAELMAADGLSSDSLYMQFRFVLFLYGSKSFP